MSLAKIAKITAITGASLGGAYLASGGILCTAALSRLRLNKEPEEALNVPYIMKRYCNDTRFHEADDWYIQNTPATVSLTTVKGQQIYAELFQQKTDSHRWVVLNHGYTSRPRYMALQGKHFYENGYHVLMPYLKGHRKDERLFTTMGYSECKDVAAWLRYIVSLDANAQIVLMGCSMGAATTMLTLKEEIPQNVKCCIEDCGYSTCWEQFTEQFTNILHVPVVPFLYAANSFSTLFLGWNFKDNRPIDAVKQTDMPMLFIHGKNDKFVPFDMVHTLYNACNAPKELLEVEGAGHDQSCYRSPELYWEKADAFVKKYIK